MSLKNLEKLGAVAGFIPFVSSVTGIIKAFVYYNKAKNSLNKGLEGSAKKTNDIGQNKFNVSQEKGECYNELWKASAVEIIPFLNIIAAIYSTTVLNKLSDLREVNKNEDSKTKFLFSKYEIPDYILLDKKTLFEALIILDGLKVEEPIQNKIKIALATMMSVSQGTAQDIVKNTISDSIDHTITQIKKLDPKFNDEITGSLDEKSLEECWQIRLELQKELTRLRQEVKKKNNEDFNFPPPKTEEVTFE